MQSPRPTFARVTLGELLDGKVDPGLLRDRIAIVGSSAISLKDYFQTPFSSAALPYLTGSELQAHHASQLVRLAPALPAVVLDEIAWWLGALVAKEGGLTNRIALTLLRPAAVASGPVTAVGRFADVTPVDRRRTFWRTRSALLAADGTLLATAAIVFRAGADYSERQMAFFRARTDPAIFERMFPNHAG